MKSAVSPGLLAMAAVSLSLLSCVSPVQAQVTQTTYDSLTALAGSNGNISNVTSIVNSNTPNGLAHNTNVPSGPAGYTFAYGPDGTENGTSSNVGGSTLSTIIVADDLWIQGDVGNPADKIQSFDLTGMRFLVTNQNSANLMVNAHIRIYDADFTDDGRYQNDGNGGFPGTLLASYDVNNVNLAAKNGGDIASVTQVSIPSSSFTSTPLTIDGSKFSQVIGSTTKYEKRIWVGLFFTAEEGPVSAEQLGNVGTVVYDVDTSIYADGVNTDGTFFDVGRSNDQLISDNIDVPNGVNGPGSNHGASPGYTSNNFANYTDTGIFQTFSFDNNNDGPEANFAYFLMGQFTIMPEPGSFAFLATGLIPVAAVIRRRKNAKR